MSALIMGMDDQAFQKTNASFKNQHLIKVSLTYMAEFIQLQLIK